MKLAPCLSRMSIMSIHQGMVGLWRSTVHAITAAVLVLQSCHAWIPHHHTRSSPTPFSGRGETATRLSAGKLSTPPSNGPNIYEDTRKQAVDAVAMALKQGVTKIEVEVPIGLGKNDVSLGEYLDESRRWALNFLNALTPKYPTPRGALWVIFPDPGEANIAAKDWGTTRYRICSIKKALEASAEEDCKLQVVITPGYNIDEFLDIEKLSKARPGMPIVVINGNLDRVRSGYYAPVFYPQLNSCKNRFLKYFDPVYYLKPLAGGFLYRKYPEAWQVFFQAYGPVDAKTKRRPIVTTLLGASDERPAYNDVAERLKVESRKAVGPL